MASPTYHPDNVQSPPSSPTTQQQTLQQHSSAGPSANPQPFPYYPTQDPQSDGTSLAMDPSSDMLAATAQMPPPFHTAPVAFPPGTVPVAYFAGPHGGIIAIPQIKHKRRQVKNACTNCQKACKKCDEQRPCTRCNKYGIAKDCTDSQRKERKKGVKRGPYKKRDAKGKLLRTCVPAEVETHFSIPFLGNQDDPEGSMAASMADSSFPSMQIPPGMAFYGYGPNGAPIVAQMPKGPDGQYSYPPQYYMPPPVDNDPNAPGQQHMSYPQYYGQMVSPYGQYPQGYMVTPSGAPSGSGQASQGMSLSPTYLGRMT